MPIRNDVRLGHGVQIYHPDLVNLYGCTIGDETKIGTFVEIQVGATDGLADGYPKIGSQDPVCCIHGLWLPRGRSGSGSAVSHRGYITRSSSSETAA